MSGQFSRPREMPMHLTHLDRPWSASQKGFQAVSSGPIVVRFFRREHGHRKENAFFPISFSRTRAEARHDCTFSLEEAPTAPRHQAFSMPYQLFQLLI